MFCRLFNVFGFRLALDSDRAQGKTKKNLTAESDASQTSSDADSTLDQVDMLATLLAVSTEGNDGGRLS